MTHSYHLRDRTIMQLTGADAITLLQGIITNDMHALETQPCIYSLLLSPQGKILCDFFLHRHDGATFIDIATDYAELFQQKFKMYRLRSDAQLDVIDTHFVVAAPDFSRRLVAALPNDASPLKSFHALRYEAGIPDAAYDATERDIAPDFGADALGGIAYDKGCYIGQEVTARMHYKHIMRKCLFRVCADALPEKATPITAGDITLGEMRGHEGSYGLAMLKLEDTRQALKEQTPITADGITLNVSLPDFLEAKAQRIAQKLANA